MANPDALLTTIRQLIQRTEDREIRAAATNMPPDVFLDELLYYVAALDDQLSAGGPLPRCWNVRPNRKADVEAWDLDREEAIRVGQRFTRLIPPYDRGRARRQMRRSRP